MPTKSTTLPLIYRSYQFSPDFPIILMQENNPAPQAVFMHFHNCIEIAICEKSRKCWNIEDQQYDFTPGDIFFIPPFHSHSSYRPASYSDEALYTYLYFNPEDILKPFYPSGLPMELLWYKYHSFTSRLQPEQYSDELLLIQAICDQLMQKGSHYQLSVRGLIQSLMVSLSRHFHNASEHPGTIRSLSRILPAVSYIGEHYPLPLTTSDLAELCHISQGQFLKDFQGAIHQTPGQYQNTIRISHACELLTRTEDSILDISLNVGFQTVATFNRYFRKILDTTPQNWRNQKRSVIKRNLKYSNFVAKKL